MLYLCASMEKGLALLTGASSGIGKELAEIMAKNGHSLILVARRTEALKSIQSELSKKYGTTIHVIGKDLSMPDSPKELYEELHQKNLKPVILVNNAGFGLFGEFAETDWSKERMMIDLNVTSLVHLTKLFLQDLKPSQPGKIMNVASTAAFQPGPLMAVYYATKSFVLSFSEAISEELHHTGITVTALCPGPTESEFQKVADMEGSKLFNTRNVPDSAAVAAFGYNAMMKGKRVAIHGKMNALMATATRFTPRWLVTRIVKYLQDKKKH